MPDNKSPGELEDFALNMIPANDDVWPNSQKYIDDIPQSVRKFNPEKKRKAELYAWLATRREPARMGAAVGAGDLKTDSAVCQNFLAWIVRLFG